MLRRPPTQIQLTSEDVLAFDDRKEKKQKQLAEAENKSNNGINENHNGTDEVVKNGADNKKGIEERIGLQ